MWTKQNIPRIFKFVIARPESCCRTTKAKNQSSQWPVSSPRPFQETIQPLSLSKRRKKINKRGLHLPNVRVHREKLKLNYHARGRPRLLKYLLEGLTVTLVHEEWSSEKNGTNSPLAIKVITFGKTLGSDPLKGSHWIADLPYLFENYENLVIRHM